MVLISRLYTLHVQQLSDICPTSGQMLKPFKRALKLPLHALSQLTELWGFKLLRTDLDSVRLTSIRGIGNEKYKVGLIKQR